MTRFWKFNAFAGTIGFLLFVVAFLTGQHYQGCALLSDKPGDALANFAWVATTNQSYYFAITGALFTLWLVTMTFLGLIVGFFRAPGNR